MERFDRAGVVAASLFAVGVVIQDWTKPAFDPLRHMVSHLSLGPWGWVNVGLLLATGALVAAFGLSLRRSGFPGGKVVPALVVVAGVALVAAAVFPIDPGLGYPPGVGATRTWRGSIHDAAGGLLFASLTAAAVGTARKLRGQPGRRWQRQVSQAAAFLMPVLFIACSIAIGMDYGGAVSRPLGGLFERLYLAVAFAWILLMSVGATRSRGSRPTAQTPTALTTG
ncbi:MAG TPA: DUF998 domain-containing protein [Acidimicrobiia bacterium]|jgi:hypothetical protein